MHVFAAALGLSALAATSATSATAFMLVKLVGAVINVNSLLWAHLLVAATSAASRGLRVSAAVLRWLNLAVGAVFVSFGVRLALAEAH